jgi:hypothetical protein
MSDSPISFPAPGQFTWADDLDRSIDDLFSGITQLLGDTTKAKEPISLQEWLYNLNDRIFALSGVSDASVISGDAPLSVQMTSRSALGGSRVDLPISAAEREWNVLDCPFAWEVGATKDIWLWVSNRDRQEMAYGNLTSTDLSTTVVLRTTTSTYTPVIIGVGSKYEFVTVAHIRAWWASGAPIKVRYRTNPNFFEVLEVGRLAWKPNQGLSLGALFDVKKDADRGGYPYGYTLLQKFGGSLPIWAPSAPLIGLSSSASAAPMSYFPPNDLDFPDTPKSE